MDWFDLLGVQVTLKNLSQHHSSKISIFQCSAKASHVLDPDKMDEFSNYILLWLAVYACMVNHIWLFVTPWTIACQAPLSMGFSRKEYCSGLACPHPGDCSPPGSSVHGILQARIVEWFAISSSRGSSRPRDQTCVSSSPSLSSKFFTTSTKIQ